MEVRIAVAGPMTGPDSPFGLQILRGAQAAAEHINNSGESSRLKIVLVQGDDASQPERAKAIAHRLVDQEKINYIIGHFNSSCTVPASEVYNEAKALNITPASTVGKVTDRGLPTVLRLCGVNDRQGERIADFVADSQSDAKVVLVHDNRPYGESLTEHTKEKLKNHKIDPVLSETINRGDRDFGGLIDKIRSKNGNVVVFSGMAAEAGPLIRQIRDKGLKDLMFFGGDGLATGELAEFAGGAEYTKDVYMTFSTDILRADRGVIDALRKQNVEPEGYTLNAYAAVETIAAGVQGVKSASGEDVVKWLKSNSVKTAMGKVEFHDTGNMRGAEFDVYKWDDKGHWHRVRGPM